MPVYRADVMVIATAYAKADTPEQAIELIKGLEMTCLTIPEGDYEELVVSGERFDMEDLPGLSLSPIMTIYAADREGYGISVEEVE